MSILGHNTCGGCIKRVNISNLLDLIEAVANMLYVVESDTQLGSVVLSVDLNRTVKKYDLEGGRLIRDT